MGFLDYIERGFRLLFKSLNLIIGLIVGGIFGTLVSVLVILFWGEFSFTEGWYWYLLPGVILGAVVGVKFWPLMLAFFLGGEDTTADFDLTIDSADTNAPDLEVGSSQSPTDDTGNKEDDKDSGW